MAGEENEESKTRKDIENYQVLQQQLQIVMMQRQQMKLQSDEIDHALGEIDKAKGTVYRIVGPILISSTKEDAVKDLQDKKELIASRTGVMEKQEERMKKSLDDLRKIIEAAQKKR